MSYSIFLCSRDTGLASVVRSAPGDDMTDVLEKFYGQTLDVGRYMLGVTFEFEGRPLPVWKKAKVVNDFSSRYNPVYVSDGNLNRVSEA